MRQIRPEELRVGNHVAATGAGNLDYSKDPNYLPDLGLLQYTIKPHDIENASWYFPIPLTSERLKEFGVGKLTNDKPYHFKIGGIEYCWFKGRGLKVFCIGAPMASYPCEYVHQLQNIYFALKEEELKTSK